MKAIGVGDRFTVKGYDDREFERIEDDPSPRFDCERMRVKARYVAVLCLRDFIFPVEDAWFHARGLVADDTPRPI